MSSHPDKHHELATPPGAGPQWVNMQGLDYLHLRTGDGGDLYVTRHGLGWAEQLKPENWFERDWFRAHRERLRGTSTVYRVRTREVGGRSIELVIKWSRMGQDVPLETHVLDDFLNAEFNTPFEEFALVEELRRGGSGPRAPIILTHRPFAIYVPPERLQLWQTGRSRDRVSRKARSHIGVELDILRQYIVIYEWIKGDDAAVTFEALGLPEAELHALTRHVQDEVLAKGFHVADMKPAHIIVRRTPGGGLLRRHGQPAWALIDFELLMRTPEHEARIREAKRSDYLRRQQDRLATERPLPPHLKRVNIMGVDYVFGHVESTQGRLWVVGGDGGLFDYFQPERWRNTNQVRLSTSHQVYYTLTKDDIHLVWKTSRVGERPAAAPGDYQGRRMVKVGYNSPFEEFARALELARLGFPTTIPRAIYMTGSSSDTSEGPLDMRAFARHRELLTPEGEPILQPDHDYIKIWGYWNGPVEMLAQGVACQSINAMEAFQQELLSETELRRLMLRAVERLTELGYESVNIAEHHFLLTLDPSRQFMRDTEGNLEFRLCNFEMVRKTR